MIDPERLAAFALMTAVTSIVPGVSMLFVMGQTIRRGWRAGMAALWGLQLGYLLWWLLAALGLGALAKAFPVAFYLLAIGGALFLAWLGIAGIRHAGEGADEVTDQASLTTHCFRHGAFVAIGNPKSLVYIVALLPPFVDQAEAVLPQIGLLMVVATPFDMLIGALYVIAGQRLARVMASPESRRRIDRAAGVIYIMIATGILADILWGWS
ncbi:MAG: LysE family translocator [Tsuneonella suprasediminis]|nr:LysE family translocator [Tsuneonella suprasediminis]UBS32312.1 LysE family translocator [Altererythrobacter sp. N1]